MKLFRTMASVCLLALSTTVALAETSWTSGEIKKVDRAQSKVTVKHGPIENLDMPSMTMVFFAPDPKVLDGLEAGQKKQFEFGDMNGRMIVKQVK
jgi:Cu(I)/Ag(I) efflux system protein CusF